MLLLGHLSREEVPPALKKDALYVLRKSPQVPHHRWPCWRSTRANLQSRLMLNYR